MRAKSPIGLLLKMAGLDKTIYMPDPISAATTFATLIGLICNYRQEKGERERLTHQKFIEWLEYHRHEEIKNLIVNTAALRTDVDQIHVGVSSSVVMGYG